MSFIDNEPPRHNNVDVYYHPEEYEIPRPKKGNILKSSNVVVLSTEEIRVLISHGVYPIPYADKKSGRKMLKLAQEQQEFARKWLLEEKNNSQNNLEETEHDKNL